MVIEPLHASNHAYPTRREHGEIERGVIGPADELQRRLLSRDLQGMYPTAVLIEHAHTIQPPQDVASPIRARKAPVLADRDRHLPPGLLQLVGDLTTGRRCAEDEHATWRQFVLDDDGRAAAIASIHGTRCWCSAGIAGRSQCPMATFAARQTP